MKGLVRCMGPKDARRAFLGEAKQAQLIHADSDRLVPNPLRWEPSTDLREG